MISINLKEYGKYLGTENFDFIVKNGDKIIQKKPFYTIKEMKISSGNYVSTKALAWASIYGIKCLVTSQSGRPLGVFLPLNYDMHVENRVKQYEAYSSERGVQIAKNLIKAKIEAQFSLLEKYDIRSDRRKHQALDKLEKLEAGKVDEIRTKLHTIEGHFGKFYCKEVFNLFPKYMQETFRQAYKAVGIINNLFNLGYEVLKWEVYKSILNAHLDPYLGFLHSIQHSKPSLVCDLQEPYRPLIDDFLINHSQKISKRDLEVKYGDRNPRIYLRHPESSELIAGLGAFLDTKIRKQRTRKYGKSSKLKTVIREDTERLASFIRQDIGRWTPTNPFLF